MTMMGDQLNQHQSRFVGCTFSIQMRMLPKCKSCFYKHQEKRKRRTAKAEKTVSPSFLEVRLGYEDVLELLGSLCSNCSCQMEIMQQAV